MLFSYYEEEMTMLFTVLSWLIILVVFGGTGFGCTKIINKLFDHEVKSLHGIIMIGLVFSTVYAEAFSTMYKLGCAAFIIISMIMLASLLYSGGEIYDLLRKIKNEADSNRAKAIGMTLIFVCFLFFASYISSRPPLGFDAYNYHVPDIRWLEEYGAVKGAGNLASRFAYNSSFHCLQALFSFAWVGGTSYHSMNGFIWLFMVLHTVFSFSFFSGKSFGMSDVIRAVFLRILFGCISWGMNEPLAAPITDFMPLCLVGYIFMEWSALNEEKETDDTAYGLLAVLGIFAVSVKLSAAVPALFAIAPVINLIMKRRYDTLIKFVIISIMVTAPFLIRNVILSGYLIYPIAGLDLFDFDWEMPKSVVVSDNVAIKLFARNEGSFQNINLQKSFSEWFDEWQRTHFPWHAMDVVYNLIIAIGVIMVSLFLMLRKKKGNYDHILYLDAAVGFLFWLFSAPSLRFGVIWFYLLPAVCIYGIIDHISENSEFAVSISNAMAVIRNGRGYFAALIIVILVCYVNMHRLLLENGFDARIIPKDYEHITDEDHTYDISGYKFYYTDSDEEADAGEGILLGYDGFPGSPKLAILKRIELRGSDLRDGFRVKEEYRNIPFSYNGSDISEDDFNLLGLDRYYKNK